MFSFVFHIIALEHVSCSNIYSDEEKILLQRILV